MYVLDSDTCIYLVEHRYPSVQAKFATVPTAEIAVSAISLGELRYGAANSQRRRANLERLENFLFPFAILPFDSSATAFYAAAKDYLRRLGTPIGSFDLLIAATVLAHDATLVTNNTRKLARVPGLKLENWLQP